MNWICVFCVFLPGHVYNYCIFDDNKEIPKAGNDYALDRSVWEFEKKNGTVEVPFYMDLVSVIEQGIVHGVLREIQKKVKCLKFVQYDKLPPTTVKHLYIRNAYTECRSYVMGGAKLRKKRNKFRRELRMYTFACRMNRDAFRHVFFHEMFHIFNIMHTQKRNDRDKYIKVIKENINSTYLKQYSKCPDCKYWKFIPYECNSIMHYSSDTFSLDSERDHWDLSVIRPTMKTKNHVTCKQSELDSYHDIPTINDWKLFNVALKCG